MPNDVPMVTSCPLCLQPDEVQSMVTVQIERTIAGGRTAITICRSCTGAVILANSKLDDPVAVDEQSGALERAEAAAEPGALERGLAAVAAPAADETLAESAQLHDGEESDDGKTTN